MDRKEIEKIVYIILLAGAIILLIFNLVTYTSCNKLFNEFKANTSIDTCIVCKQLEGLGLIAISGQQPK